jgi:hypothetical protein
MLKNSVIITCLVAAALTGCGDQNPLIGRWTAAQGGVNGRYLEFKTDALGSGDGQDIPVTYKVNGTYVSVTPMATGETGFLCKVVNQNNVECTMPDGTTSSMKRII